MKMHLSRSTYEKGERIGCATRSWTSSLAKARRIWPHYTQIMWHRMHMFTYCLVELVTTDGVKMRLSRSSSRDALTTSDYSWLGQIQAGIFAPNLNHKALDFRG